MEEQMPRIKQNLKASQDRKKNYAEKNKNFRDFEVGEHVFLKVKERRILIRLGCFPKLVVTYYGPFEILEKIGPVSYMIAFPASMRVHNVFHVLLLNKYVSGPNHIIDWIVIQVENGGDFQVEPVHILERKVIILWNKYIGLLKVQWTYYGLEYATWEHE
jgi:hypothetical protein